MISRAWCRAVNRMFAFSARFSGQPTEFAHLHGQDRLAKVSAADLDGEADVLRVDAGKVGGQVEELVVGEVPANRPGDQEVVQRSLVVDGGAQERHRKAGESWGGGGGGRGLGEDTDGHQCQT